MTSPRLPLKPASAAIVVVLRRTREAVRTPAKISGIASGSSTRVRIRGSRHAHPARGVDELGVDAVDGEVGVGDDRRHREDHERELDDGQPEPEEGVTDREYRETRQRATEVAER